MQTLKILSFIALLCFCSVLLFIIIFFWKDIHFNRGYYYFELFDYDQPNLFSNSKPDFNYSILQNDDGTLTFTLKNDGFNYAYFYTYRNYSKDFELTDSLVFLIASRHIIKNDKDSIIDDPDFACGTGLSRIYIKPLEEFKFRTRDIYQFIHFGCLGYYKNRLETFSHRDSISIQFYLPVYAFGSDMQYKVASNPFFISYSRLCEEIEKYERSAKW